MHTCLAQSSVARSMESLWFCRHVLVLIKFGTFVESWCAVLMYHRLLEVVKKVCCCTSANGSSPTLLTCIELQQSVKHPHLLACCHRAKCPRSSSHDLRSVSKQVVFCALVARETGGREGGGGGGSGHPLDKHSPLYLYVYNTYLLFYQNLPYCWI